MTGLKIHFAMKAMDSPSPHSLVGKRLGAYDVIARLGAGGMGEVYRARDAMLGREVALKVLSPAIANDPERQARFEREARLLAALNHPNIATIHGFEEHAGIHTLVMELVEGPTLTERLAHGPLPVQEALTAARQIADALEEAHEKGVIHRDLKPANIKLKPDGTVKVLDFGLAKACDPHETSDVATAPTVTALRTGAGVILGTPAYMSPEQARGQIVDKRTDIWAFGCVLYEMLTGRPAFAGGTASDTLARVFERDPDWSKLPAGMLTPPRVRRLLRRCLEKKPKQRLRDIGDARLELDDSPWTSDATGLPAPPRGQRINLAWTAAGLTVVAMIAGVLGWTLKPAVTPAVSRFSHVLPVEMSLALGPPGRSSRSRRMAPLSCTRRVFPARRTAFSIVGRSASGTPCPFAGRKARRGRRSFRPMGCPSGIGIRRPANCGGLPSTAVRRSR